MVPTLSAATHRAVRTTLAVAALLSGFASGAATQCVFEGDTADLATPTRTSTSAYPRFDLRNELGFLGLGADLVFASRIVPPQRRTLPLVGFDPREISLSIDRRVVGSQNRAAVGASDRTLHASVLWPVALAWVTAESGKRWSELGRTGAIYVETIMISGGITQLGKRTFGRARPFAYLAAEERPGAGASSPPARGTFHSMPSGHSSGAWAGASLAVTEHLLRRPAADWPERAAVGFVGGALASATSALRVEGGVHFPTDVVVGAALGITAGVAVPLLHRDGRELPARRAWLPSVGGAVVGTVVGVALARSY